MNPFTAVLDACVLYPFHLRNLFMYMARVDLFRAKWTNDIHEEWIGSLLTGRSDDGWLPLTPEPAVGSGSAVC